MEWDSEAAELRYIAEASRMLRHEEAAREIEERLRDEEVRRHKAWEEKTDAISARLDIVERLVRRPLWWIITIMALVVVTVQAVRLFT